MRISCLATTMTLATMTLAGCGSNTTTAQPDASARFDTSAQPDVSGRSDVASSSDTSVKPEPFELEGDWLYLGPWDGEHTLKISDGSMEYADIDGSWSSKWTIKDYDNGLHRYQITFQSGNGSYYPDGQSLSGTYVVSGMILSVQLAKGLGSYVPVQFPGSCTDDSSNRIPDCKLYMKQ
jgi:hypothetical protein